MRTSYRKVNREPRYVPPCIGKLFPPKLTGALGAVVALLPLTLSGQFTGTIDSLVTSSGTSSFNIIVSSDGVTPMADDRADQQTGQYADDMVGGTNATDAGFMMNVVSWDDPNIAGWGSLDYLVFRVRQNIYDAGGYESNSRTRFGIDADADGDIDLFFGFDGSNQGLPTVAFQDSGTDLNISPNTSSIGNLFTPTLEAGDSLFDTYNGSDLAGDVTALMTLIDGFTFDYQQATNLANGDPGYASKKANTPDADSYVTFAIPFDLLGEAIEEASVNDTREGGQITDFSLNSSIRLIAYTATQSNAINQDLFGVNGIDKNATFEASGAFSPISDVYGVVPEASTFAQVGAFMWVAAGLYFRRRHHVCRRPEGVRAPVRIT